MNSLRFVLLAGTGIFLGAGLLVLSSYYGVGEALFVTVLILVGARNTRVAFSESKASPHPKGGRSAIYLILVATYFGVFVTIIGTILNQFFPLVLGLLLAAAATFALANPRLYVKSRAAA